jgi:hypothetical protein
MNLSPRFQLKQPSGWFAAGREVDCALQLLSDSAFKLFLWLCLHAERNRGSLAVTPEGLAQALTKDTRDIHRALEELQRKGVCVLDANGILQITDRFWPYRRPRENADLARSEASYVEEVKRLFLQRRCVHSSFTGADEKLARSLYRRGTPLSQVEHAILLGAVRKYTALFEHGRGTPITSLHYFAHLFAEVQQEVSPQYWTYMARKVTTFEQQWAGFIPASPNQQDSRKETK